MVRHKQKGKKKKKRRNKKKRRKEETRRKEERGRKEETRKKEERRTKKEETRKKKNTNVCRVSALYVVLCVVVMSHPQPSLSGTGVLWVSTGTHQCVDPPRQGGGSTMRQLAHCVDRVCRA